MAADCGEPLSSGWRGAGRLWAIYRRPQEVLGSGLVYIPMRRASTSCSNGGGVDPRRELVRQMGGLWRRAGAAGGGCNGWMGVGDQGEGGYVRWGRRR